MNGTLKKALRWIALPAMLVVLLTCSAFAVSLDTENSTVTVTDDTATVTVRFNVTQEYDDIVLMWYGTDETGVVTTEGNQCSLAAGYNVPKGEAGDYVSLKFQIKMGDGATASVDTPAISVNFVGLSGATYEVASADSSYEAISTDENYEGTNRELDALLATDYVDKSNCVTVSVAVTAFSAEGITIEAIEANP